MNLRSNSKAALRIKKIDIKKETFILLGIL